MPSRQYVDLILDGVGQLLQHAESVDTHAWRLVARHAITGRSDRFAVLVRALITAMHADRGPLLQVALARLTDQTPPHLRHLDGPTADLVLEAMLSALVAGSMRDLLSDADYRTLLAPLTLSAAPPPRRRTIGARMRRSVHGRG